MLTANFFADSDTWVCGDQKSVLYLFGTSRFCNIMASWRHQAQATKSEIFFLSNIYDLYTDRKIFSGGTKVSLGPGSGNQLRKSYWGSKFSIWPFDVMFEREHPMTDVRYITTTENTHENSIIQLLLTVFRYWLI